MATRFLLITCLFSLMASCSKQPTNGNLYCYIDVKGVKVCSFDYESLKLSMPRDFSGIISGKINESLYTFESYSNGERTSRTDSFPISMGVAIYSFYGDSIFHYEISQHSELKQVGGKLFYLKTCKSKDSCKLKVGSNLVAKIYTAKTKIKKFIFGYRVFYNGIMQYDSLIFANPYLHYLELKEHGVYDVLYFAKDSVGDTFYDHNLRINFN